MDFASLFITEFGQVESLSVDVTKHDNSEVVCGKFLTGGA